MAMLDWKIGGAALIAAAIPWAAPAASPPPVPMAIAAAAAPAGPDQAIPGASLDCAYLSRRLNDLAEFRHCTWTDRQGRRRLKAKHIQDLDFDGHGLGSINLRSSWAYVRRDGLMAPVETVDNGPDPFVDGLARSDVGGKVGFIDRRFRFVIPARYDGAHGFKNGKAVICIGCVLKRDPDNEHSWYEGGRWGCIDRHGRELYPEADTAGVGDMLDRCQ